MTKVILKGKPSCQWFLDGQQICGGVERELTSKQLKEAKSSNLIEKMIGEDIIEPVPKATKIYTESELKAKNKDQQLNLIKKLGIELSKENNNLRLEKDRINAILEAQK